MKTCYKFQICYNKLYESMRINFTVDFIVVYIAANFPFITIDTPFLRLELSTFRFYRYIFCSVFNCDKTDNKFSIFHNMWNNSRTNHGIKLNKDSFRVRTPTFEAQSLLISNVLPFGQDVVQLYQPRIEHFEILLSSFKLKKKSL